jgi:hypothetical protein
MEQEVVAVTVEAILTVVYQREDQVKAGEVLVLVVVVVCILVVPDHHIHIIQMKAVEQVMTTTTLLAVVVIPVQAVKEIFFIYHQIDLVMEEVVIQQKQ